MTDFVMIVRLRLILFWLLTSTCAIGAKQLIIKDVGPSLSALVSYDTIHKAFKDESSNVYLAQTHDLHTSADQKHLSNSAEFNKIAAKQSLIPFLAYCVATNKGGKVIAPAKRNSNSTVLGHHPEYSDLADRLGHRRFDIPTSVWDEMSDAQRWTANQKF